MNSIFIAYGALGLAIVCEVVGTTFLQKSEQFTRLVPSLVMVTAYIGSFYFLSQALNHLPPLTFAALRFTGPGTDLTVGLADDHEWCGGASASRSGIVCNANIPTEEVFTTPHRDRVEGVARSSR